MGVESPFSARLVVIHARGGIQTLPYPSAAPCALAENGTPSEIIHTRFPDLIYFI